MSDHFGTFDSSSQAGFHSTSGDFGTITPGSTDSQESIGSLISGLLRDLQDMVRGEISLARAEVRDDLSTASKGLTSLAAAALVGVTGFIFLMLGVTYLLNQYWRMWIAAGAVGLALLVIAAIAAAIGKSKLSATSLKPAQTIDSLKEDREWAKQQVSSVKQ
ncbi:MAG: phage holin family protein [Thermomicrobiales bacterium]|jgi:uncharacterized membrane protein YqjE